MTIDQIPVNGLNDDVREGVIAMRAPAAAGTYAVVLSAPFDFDIVSAAYGTDVSTSTIDWRLEIANTPVEFTTGDGSENVQADDEVATDTTDAAFSVTAGQLVELVLSSPANSPVLFSLDIFIRRTG